MKGHTNESGQREEENLKGVPTHHFSAAADSAVSFCTSKQFSFEGL